MERRYASIDQVVEYLGGNINPTTIRRWIAAGHLPGYRFGGLIRVDLNDVDAFGQQIPTAQARPGTTPRKLRKLATAAIER